MVDVPPPAVVAILTRAPSRGGKSRLFAALDRPPDPALLSALLLDTLDGVTSAGTTRVVLVEPADACDEVRALLPDEVRVMAQADGTLGDRMRAAMQDLFDEGASIVVLVGSDLPDIAPQTIDDAISHLRSDAAALVLGPAHDGGYYLIAATRVPEVFDDIEWSSSQVFEQTRAAAAKHGLRVHLLDPLRDVDTPDDLQHVRARRTRSWCRGAL
jgi:rSAM/selenodomain-associated transferase 1